MQSLLHRHNYKIAIEGLKPLKQELPALFGAQPALNIRRLPQHDCQRMRAQALGIRESIASAWSYKTRQRPIRAYARLGRHLKANCMSDGINWQIAGEGPQ